MNTGILKRIERLSLTRKKSASFSASDGSRVFLIFGLNVSSTVSALGTKGLQYSVLGKKILNVSFSPSFVEYFSDLHPLHTFKTFLPKLLKVSHQDFFCVKQVLIFS